MPKVILGIKLFTFPEVAELLGVQPASVTKYAKERGLKSQTIGGTKYVSEENLKEFIQSDEKTIRE
jgi:predicted transcriptional regulator